VGVKMDMELEAAYLAGLVDGDGTIGVYMHRRNGANYSPRLRLAMTDKGVLDYLSSVWGGNVVESSYSTGRLGTKRYYILQWMAHSVLMDILFRIMPFLHGKRPQAEALLEYCRSRNNGVAHSAFSPYEIELSGIISDLNRGC